METPKTLQEAVQFFGEYENCREFMVAIRWPDGKVRCPRCESEKVGYLERARVYVCYEGHKRAKFSLKVGTVLEDSPIALEKWLPALWLIASAKNGISSWELHRALGVTQKSAWFMLHRIRTAMAHGGFGNITKIGGEGSEVECDESWIGGSVGNMHKRKRAEIGGSGGIKNKTIVMGMLDRESGHVRAEVIPFAQRDFMESTVHKHVKFGSTVYTDEHVGYIGLRNRYSHDTVNHMETYVKGRVHTNGIENFWSLLQRQLLGTYVAVEPYHLHRYVDEEVFRYSYRGGKRKGERIDDGQRFAKLLSQIVGKRLTYAELTGKVGETSF
jgi:transposase-like protein